MDLQFPKLAARQQRGSKPRCHLLTHGARKDVAARLSSLIQPWGVVRPQDRWMPAGFESCREARLHSASELVPDPALRGTLLTWWLKVAKEKTETPNIDLASTCLVEGREGLLLIEAKAHDYELLKEEQGKQIEDGASDDTRRNHAHIAEAISKGNASLTEQTGLPWALSRDSRYQMSNRFAWSWKLAELGVPVILIYLAFTDCEEMRRGKSQNPIVTPSEWEALVHAHSAPLFPSEVWNHKWLIQGQPFIPLIRTTAQTLDFNQVLESTIV